MQLTTPASLLDKFNYLAIFVWISFAFIGFYVTFVRCIRRRCKLNCHPNQLRPLIDICMYICIYTYTYKFIHMELQLWIKWVAWAELSFIRHPWMISVSGSATSAKYRGWRHSFVALLCARLLCVGSATFPFPAFVRTSLLSVRKNGRTSGQHVPVSSGFLSSWAIFYYGIYEIYLNYRIKCTLIRSRAALLKLLCKI